MGDRAIRVTYIGLKLEASDFVTGTFETKEPVLCDVTALVSPAEDAIEVEITKVSLNQSFDNLAGSLRHETEYRIKPLMRSLYLNVARDGHEGDAPSEEIA